MISESASKIFSFTGHRPPKLGGYDDAVNLCSATKILLRQLLLAEKPERCNVGMALGFDQWVAAVCIELDIPFKAYIPFRGYQSRWPVTSQQKYDALLDHAAEIDHLHSTSGANMGITAMYMQERNIKMVDHSGRLIALWDGTSGGTKNCVTYGRRVKKYNDETDNLWPRLHR